MQFKNYGEIMRPINAAAKVELEKRKLNGKTQSLLMKQVRRTDKHGTNRGTA